MTGLDSDGSGVSVSGPGREPRRAGFVVACAGAGSDRLAVAAGAPAEPRIVPFRGGYLRLRPERAELVRANVYPVPDPDLPFLGAHLTRTYRRRGAARALRPAGRRPRLAGDLAGDGAATGEAARPRSAAPPAARSFVAEARRLVPELEAARLRRRARRACAPRPSTATAPWSTTSSSTTTERALHVRNAPSPAATSSLALARLIADQVERRA